MACLDIRKPDSQRANPLEEAAFASKLCAASIINRVLTRRVDVLKYPFQNKHSVCLKFQDETRSEYIYKHDNKTQLVVFSIEHWHKQRQTNRKSP